MVGGGRHQHGVVQGRRRPAVADPRGRPLGYLALRDDLVATAGGHGLDGLLCQGVQVLHQQAGHLLAHQLLQDARQAQAQLPVENPEHGGGRHVAQQHAAALVGAQVEDDVRLVL